MPDFRIIATDLQFPEGPIAMPDGSVILVEIRRQTLTRAWPDGRQEIIAHIPGGPNGAAMGPDGKVYVCNNGGNGWVKGESAWLPRIPTAAEYLGGSLQRVDIVTGRVETIFDRCGDEMLKGPNDLVFDRQGGLWFTDLGKFRPRDMDQGAVYYMSPGGGQLTEVAFPMLGPNGIGLSPDEKRVYVAEMQPARLWSFELDAPGQVRPVRNPLRGETGTCIAGLGGFQMFDSLAVEACGNICVATMLTGFISVIGPDGAVVERIETGDPATSNICFGGPDLRTAYITLSRRGELAMMDWPRPGLPLNFLNR